jgi:hypothetical protein
MRNRRFFAALAGAIALLFLAGCGDSTAPDILTADDADVLAAKPAPPPDRHDIYFISVGSDPTVIPLCVIDDSWDCTESAFEMTWATHVTEVLGFHKVHRRFDMAHRLDIHQGATHVGGFTTSNAITCREMPCSTSRVRLHRKDWVPLENGEGLAMPFDGNVNLVFPSKLVEDGDVAFVAGRGGIHGRVVFSWTAP